MPHITTVRAAGTLVLGLVLTGVPRSQAVSAEPAAAVSAATKDIFLFIPHTHWEGAVFKTREEYLEMGLPHILRALKLLKAYPQYRFVLDQVCYVKPFLERFPEQKADFLQYVREGRLAIVGGTDVMLDVNMPGGESYVRQVLYGKGYYRRALDVDVTVGWQLDTFGHHAQMPQLLKLGGYKSFWFFRGVASWDTPSEFLWEGLDGSRIPAFWLPHGYAHTYGSPNSLPEFADFMKGRYGALDRFARGVGRVGLAGADVCAPEEHVPELIDQFNRLESAPFELRLAVPTDFESLVSKRADRPVVHGELNPIFQGAYSSRIELKQRTRELEYLLLNAEKLGVLLRGVGLPIDDDIVWRGWEPMLFNQAHDLMSGVMTDRVFTDTIRSDDFSRRLASDEVQSRWRSLTDHIDTRGPGIPIAVWNGLGWPRTDIAFTHVGFDQGDVLGLRLTGADGQVVPLQMLSSERYANGSLLRAEIAFVARDVPPLGHAVYWLEPETSAPTSPAAPPEAPVLENEFFRLTCDLEGGALTSLRLKSDDWEAFRSPANVVAQEADHGDLWEPYTPLDGGSRIAMTTQHGVPAPDKAVFSNQFSGTAGTVSRGPVVSEFKVAHPFGAQGQIATTVRLYTGLQRIEIRTELLNQDQFVRYRVLFPTTIPDGQAVHEIPFGAIQRPAGIEFPAQNWVDLGDGQHGLALLNRGLPGNNVDAGTMMLSLLRSTRIVAYGFGGGYEPGMSSDSGFEQGKQLTFNYALVPHADDWTAAAIYRHGMEYNHPLLCSTVATHPGALPNRAGFLTVMPENVVVSALKSGPDGSTVLRVYEATGQRTRATLQLTAPVTAAEEVNLMEDPGSALTTSGNLLQLDLHPFEIKTIKFKLQPPHMAGR